MYIVLLQILRLTFSSEIDVDPRTTIIKYPSKKETFLQLKNVNEEESIYDSKPLLENVDPSLSIDVSSVIGKPFWTETVTWSTVSTNPILIDQIPTVPAAASKHVAKALSLGALSRYKICAHIAVTGTLSHQGLLVAAAVPPNSFVGYNDYRYLNTLLSCPHVFLNANEATTTCLDIPFYSPTPLVMPALGGIDTTISPNILRDTASLVIFQINPLVAGTGASTSVSVVVEYEFKELEIYVSRPITTDVTFITQSGLANLATSVMDSVATNAKTVTSDIIDNLRAAVRGYTGLHNPNAPALPVKMIRATKNNSSEVDDQSRIEKLDPYSHYDRINHDLYFHTKRDEMMVRDILSKPQFVGTFITNSADPVGKILWARPISPCQGFNTIATTAGAAPQIANNIELLYYLSRAWRGSLKLHIQSVMTPKHVCRLQLIRYYQPAQNILAATGANGLPTMGSLTACPKDTLEFTQGGQIAEVTLSYNSRTRALYNTRDLSCNALQHGMYYIYLQQPLVAGDNVATTVSFNVYLSAGDDFEYYGYSTDSLVIGNQETFLAQSSEGVGTMASDPMCTFAESMIKPSCQEPLIDRPEPSTQVHDSILRPLVSIRDLVRRFTPVASFSAFSFVKGADVASVALTTLLAQYSVNSAPAVSVLPFLMYYGFNGGLKFKLKLFGTTNATVRYLPPAISYDATNGQYTRMSSSLAAGIGSDLVSPTPLPFIEAPQNFTTSPLATDAADEGAVSTYEFTIPNVTVYDFIVRNYVNASGNSNSSYSPTTNLGDILINVPNSTTTPLPVSAMFYIAFTDETRFGFHTHAPLCAIPVSGGVFNSPYSNFNTSTFVNVGQTFAPVPYCYYSTSPITNFN